ncbi:uncharacterized protein (DUF2164 family) [Rhodobium orientis]|uniref:Uncharacterized protein n=1 Tax=Rhodobium orientis TaxID=34017 RepID=A0A327JIB2_9HYPH|nr:DUF6384 family protein [Rhodobium orientis]MBB4301801.1 uncharacterized protein (DUF2164 family) [Rhodobium orientis]MBK5950599.1 hypothetical protein [Rhodobium orientis]RAI24562.1 hypothetical protein CH339_22140 [Rhodobium orientis]
MSDTAQKKDQPLDELMMAMDVVDTLRHRDRLVTRELAADLREDQLVDRLREIYRNQGIEVTDEILAQGVAALAEERFVYSPPDAGFSRTLALLYIRRGSFAKWIGGIVVVVVLAVAGWYFLLERPQQQAAAELTAQLTTGIPRQIETTLAAISRDAKDPAVIDRATAIANDGLAAAKAENAAAARKAVADLNALQAQLRQAYDVMIVSRPGTPSGASRIPDVNRQARNYYLIVEAIDRNGTVVPLPIKSEEDGTTTTVEQWGVRVPKSVYDRVGRDKRRDGIVDEARIGVKQRGFLEPRWSVAVEDGRITKW